MIGVVMVRDNKVRVVDYLEDLQSARRKYFFLYPAGLSLLSGGFLDLLGFFISAKYLYRLAAVLIILGFVFSALNVVRSWFVKWRYGRV